MQRELRKVPLFPLNIVGTPGATRQLRIFEPRYRQMFQDVFNEVRVCAFSVCLVFVCVFVL